MAASYLLDTNAIIAALNGSASMSNRLAKLAPSRVHLSAIVLAELQAGAEKCRAPAKAHAAIAELTQHFEPLPFDADAAHACGRIRAALERKGKLIGPMDLLIAAQAISRGLALVTDNEREFKRVPGLHCENWLR